MSNEDLIKRADEIAENESREVGSAKKGIVLLYLSVFFGLWGFDRFYVGKIKSGILKWITGGGLGIWWLIDIITISRGKFTDSKNRIIPVKNSKKHGCIVLVLGFLILVGIGTTVSIIDIANKKETENQAYETAAQLFKNGNYWAAANSLRTISPESENYKHAQTLLVQADSLAEVNRIQSDSLNYKNGMKLFNEKKYKEASIALKKVREKYEKYKEIQETIKLIDAEQFKNLLKEKIKVIAPMKYLEWDADFIVVFYAALNEQRIEIEKAETYPDAEIQKLGKQLRKKVSSIQAHDFPLLRKSYASAVAEAFWKNDYEVSIRGSKNSTLEFVHTMFVKNANKDAFMKEVLAPNEEIIRTLRFKRINLKWSKYSDEITYYTFKTPEDTQLVQIGEN